MTLLFSTVLLKKRCSLNSLLGGFHLCPTTYSSTSCISFVIFSTVKLRPCYLNILCSVETVDIPSSCKTLQIQRLWWAASFSWNSAMCVHFPIHSLNTIFLISSLVSIKLSSIFLFFFIFFSQLNIRLMK